MTEMTFKKEKNVSDSDAVQYDKENNVLYVKLSNKDVSQTRALDDLRLVDYDSENQPAGIEFISASDGLDLADAPAAKRIQKLLTEAGIDFPVFA